MVKIPTDEWRDGYEYGFHKGYLAALDVARRDIGEREMGKYEQATPKPVKRTRKPSAYNKRYAAEYRKLKKKHPRMSFSQLSKKAHKVLRRKK